MALIKIKKFQTYACMGGKLFAIFRRSGSEFIILQIPMTENLRFWFWTDTGDNIFFSVGN
jgi:hypothetical protein